MACGVPWSWGVLPVLAPAWGLCRSSFTLHPSFWTKWCFWNAKVQIRARWKSLLQPRGQCVPLMWPQLWTHVSDKGQTPSDTQNPPTLGPGPRVTWWERLCVRSSGAHMGPLGHPPTSPRERPTFRQNGSIWGGIVNSRRWWWTGRPGVLRFRGSQRVGHDWATKLNWRKGKHSSDGSTASTLRTWFLSFSCGHLAQARTVRKHEKPNAQWRVETRSTLRPSGAHLRVRGSYTRSLGCNALGAPGEKHSQETHVVRGDPRSHSRARPPSWKPPLALVIPKSWQPRMNLCASCHYPFWGFLQIEFNL